MWVAILGSALGLSVAGIIYLISRFRRFGIVHAIAGERVWLQRLIALIPITVIVVFGVFETVNTVIVVLHLALFWLFADIVTAIAGRVIKRGKNTGTDPKTDAGTVPEAGSDTAEGKPFKVYWKGIIVILVCAVYLGFGWYNAHHVDRTAYELSTEKSLPGGKLRIAQIADSHIGTTFDGEGFASYMQTIQKDNPDIVVVTGDFVDDSSTKEDMVAACRALGAMQTTYGVYFVYGNHDKGYYNSRDYTPEELDAELRNNGVIVMEDKVAVIADCVCIIGRRDRNEGERKNGTKRLTMDEITKELDKSCYTIVLDHQPNDYDAEAAAGADLVLSGHTHGGQLIPLGPIGRWIGANDRTYGMEQRGGTTFIVTSGISDWEIYFKTGTKSEYVIIDITEK
ncbi:MAG: metallophosphoesterase [Lachnospiraceae bacterium]|nr:metallophosphoesterase [Lachnospiraceae bacterium]